MARLLHRLGAVAFRRRIAFALIWLLLLVGAGVGAKTLGGTLSNTMSIPGQESTVALDLMGQRFGAGANGATAQVTFETTGAVTDPANAAAITKAVAALGQLPGVIAASNPLDPAAPSVSRDRRAAISTVHYAVSGDAVPLAQKTALVDAVASFGIPSLQVAVTGQASENRVPSVAGPREMLGLVVAVIVLLITYGSLAAAGMNLLTAVVGVGLGSMGTMIASGFIDLQSTTPILGLMLGLAVGIDYALFIFARFRHELRIGNQPGEAAAMAVGTAGSAVLTAGLTVVIALSGLFVAGLPFLTEMGLAAAGTVVIAVLSALTLVPAVLGFMGYRALPRRERTAAMERAARQVHDERVDEPVARGFIAGWAGLTTRRGWVTLVAAALVLGTLSIPVLSMRTTLAQESAPGTTQAQADAVIARHFGPGLAGPLIVLIDGAGAVDRASIIAHDSTTLADVLYVMPPTPAPSGTAAFVTIIPRSGPSEQSTVDLVNTLRQRFQTPDGPKVYVTGTTAVSVDVTQSLNHALPLYLLLVVGLAFLLLVLVFRSLLVPLVGVIGFLLTVGATFGSTTAAFQWGWLSDVLAVPSGPLMSLMPIMVIGILFGLAMDYQVFLVSRMHEAHAHGSAAREAVTFGFRQAAPVVIAAATIMFSVFAGFISSKEAMIKPIAFALAVGIIFDAFVVRMIIVPSALALMGRAAWRLPRWLQWLPELDVEGAALERRFNVTGGARPTGEATPVSGH
ncbi:MAG: MMPL family transporter [Candidatus Nanopelagicales bacterium]